MTKDKTEAMTISIHTPKDGQTMNRQSDFVCFGFAEYVPPEILGRQTNMVATLTSNDTGLSFGGLRLPDSSLPPRPGGTLPYDWGFYFPVLPKVFYDGPATVSVQLILDDGTTVDADPHTIADWKGRFDVEVSIDGAVPTPPPFPTVARTFSAYGQSNPSSATIYTWLSNTGIPMQPLPGTTHQGPFPTGVPMGETWVQDFNATGWANPPPPGSTTKLNAQATATDGSSNTATPKTITFSG
jgi:hypothetical protein